VSLATLAAGAVLAGGLGQHDASSAGEAPKGGTLRIAAVNIDFVDPALGYLRDSWLLQDATCARLFDFAMVGDGDWRVVPEVVDRFTVSRDGRTYTFALRDTFRFHTGARVTAQSFADAFNRVAALRSPRSPATNYMSQIVGAPAVIDGKARSISGIRVLGRQVLQIRLAKSLGDLTARLTMPFFCPIPPSTPVDAPIQQPAGSGPYYISEHIVNRRITLRRNPFYRGRRPSNVDRMVWTTGESVTACLLAVEEDRADLCGGPGAPRDAWRGLVAKYGINRPGGRLFVTPMLATRALSFNHARPAFHGPGQIPLKKAVNFAIDRPAMVRPFGYLGGTRTDQMLPPALARSASVYPLGGANPAAARRWYQRARFKPTTLVLYAQATPALVALAEILDFNLKQIGIDLEVRYFEDVGDRVATPGEPFDMAIFGWGTDYGDGASFFEPFFGRGSLEHGFNLDDTQLERRIDAVNRLRDEARRRGWADLDVELMRDNPPWAPFMHIQQRTLVSASVGCYRPDPRFGIDITALCKKR
jgi:ABC-type oligopeptide transport system substrate-binding subunit